MVKRSRKIRRKYGGMKTPLMLKAMSKYLNPNSGSDLSLRDQLRFEEALSKTRSRIPTMKRSDMYGTLKRSRSRPPSAMIDLDIKNSNWLVEGGRRKSFPRLAWGANKRLAKGRKMRSRSRSRRRSKSRRKTKGKH